MFQRYDLATLLREVEEEASSGSRPSPTHVTQDEINELIRQRRERDERARDEK